MKGIEIFSSRRLFTLQPSPYLTPIQRGIKGILIVDFGVSDISVCDIEDSGATAYAEQLCNCVCCYLSSRGPVHQSLLICGFKWLFTRRFYVHLDPGGAGQGGEPQGIPRLPVHQGGPPLHTGRP